METSLLLEIGTVQNEPVTMKSLVYFPPTICQEAEHLDVWRIEHPVEKQYTWVQISDSRVSAARLDRIHV